MNAKAMPGFASQSVTSSSTSRPMREFKIRFTTRKIVSPRQNVTKNPNAYAAQGATTAVTINGRKSPCCSRRK